MKLERESFTPYMTTMRTMGHLFRTSEGTEIMNDPTWYIVPPEGNVEAISIDDLLDHLSPLYVADLVYGLECQVEKLKAKILEKTTAEKKDPIEEELLFRSIWGPK